MRNNVRYMKAMIRNPFSFAGKAKGVTVTQEKGVYQIYDRFLGIWLKENY